MEQYTFLKKLLGLFEDVDSTFNNMKEEFSDEIKCEIGCDDCCHACFTVNLAEAVLLKETITSLSDDQYDALLKRTEESRSELEELRKTISIQTAEDQNITFGKFRLRCPLLLADKSCLVYEFRPLTCRAYGLPISVEGDSHVCGFSGFGTGKTYPTIKLDKINKYMQELSDEAVKSLEMSDDSNKRYFIHEIILKQDIITNPVNENEGAQ